MIFSQQWQIDFTTLVVELPTTLFSNRYRVCTANHCGRMFSTPASGCVFSKPATPAPGLHSYRSLSPIALFRFCLHCIYNFLKRPPNLLVIPSKRFSRSEGSGRAARSVAFSATHYWRVGLASLSSPSCTETFTALASQPPVYPLRHRKPSLAQHRSQNSRLCRFQPFLDLACSCLPRAVCSQHQNDSVRQLPQQPSLTRYPGRGPVNHRILKLIAQFRQARTPIPSRP